MSDFILLELAIILAMVNIIVGIGIFVLVLQAIKLCWTLVKDLVRSKK